jgi:hypothetical protein
MSEPTFSDPLLRTMLKPSETTPKSWKRVASTYFEVARQYSRENNRHIAEVRLT